MVHEIYFITIHHAEPPIITIMIIDIIKDYCIKKKKKKKKKETFLT